MDKALRASDELEKALSQKLTDIYGKAALKSVKDLKGLFADMAELEEQSPPSWMSERQAQRWRQQELDKLMQKHKAESTVMQAIMAAGVVSVPLLWGFLTDVYLKNSTYTADAIKTAVKTRWKPKTQQRREVEILLKDKQPPFSKIAFNNLQTAPAMERRLRNEMRQAVLHGENQQKIVRRIRNVMGNSAYNARRIAQTERTRVQSQARSDTIREAAEAGVVMHKRWSTRMVNSRESHIELNGKEIDASEKFRTILGSVMDYPGDPNGKAGDVINCHCVLVPVVLPPEEKRKESTENLENTGKHGIMKLDLQWFAEKDLSKQKTASLKKGIASFETRIAEHKEKLAHPEYFDESWEKKSDNAKKGLLKHWEKEIQNFEESVRNRMEELEKRGEHDE